jgi:sigma-E factor negative regulatory protein RseC
MSEATITHQGIIDSVSLNSVNVRIVSASACSACHANGACNASDMQEKIIEANPGDKKLKVGEWVTIISKESMGFKALFLGYIIPFLVVLVTLIIATLMSMSETVAGILSVGMLVPYYAVLYLTKDRVKKSFIFEIQ